MSETAIARTFTHGRSQAVRLHKEFRLPGDLVRVRHMGDGVLLEPIASVPLFDDGRRQPPTSRRGHLRVRYLLDFDDEDARTVGQVRAALEKDGHPDRRL